jgi:uncharacterized protein with beta-barrel porin domain
MIAINRRVGPATLCAAAVLVFAHDPAGAQFVCTTTATDQTCTNSGNAPSGTNVSVAKNVLTTNSGVVTGGVITSTVNGSAAATNSGSVGNTLDTNTINGNATTTNSGSAGGGITTNTINGNATTTNSGSVSVAINTGVINGNATTTNSGAVTGNIGTNTNIGNATSTNSGSVSNSILTLASNGAATSTNSGAVTGSLTTGSGTGNATTTNSGSVGNSIMTTAGTGAATTTNSGAVTGSLTTTTFTGNATVTNSGSVSSGVNTVSSNGAATSTNSGAVTGTLSTVSTNGNATTINSGTVNGSAVVVAFNGTETLVNSGRISNFGGAAITLGGGPDTLTLLPGSFIIGGINLGGTNDTVNVRTGNLNLTFNTLAGATVTGTVPFVVSGNRIVSVDPTSFALADRTLMDFTRAVSGLIEGRGANEVTGGGGSGALGFASTNDSSGRFDDVFASLAGNAYAANNSMVFKNPTVTTAGGYTVWAKGFVGERIQQADGPILRSMTNFYGGAIGVDGLVNPVLRVGGFAGGGATRMSIDANFGGTNSDIAFGGGYGRYDIGPAFVDFALLGGHTQNSTTRSHINNNLLANGLEAATASFGGWFISPEIAYGYRYGFAGNWTLTPTARLRYVAAEFDGFTETGSTANLTAGSRTLHNFEERGDLTLTQTSTFANAEQLRTSARVGVLGLQRIGDGGINAILLGQALAFATPGKSSVFGGYTGLGFDWRTRSGVSFFATGEYTAMSDSSTTVTGKGGIRVAF